jgi:eukaryotic-like serine/threonine-protein kinase
MKKLDLLSVFSATACLLFVLVQLSPLMAINASSSNNDNSQNATTISMNMHSKTNSSNNLILYTNPAYGIKIQYPSDWKLVERNDTGYHMLNVIVEFLQAHQSSYYDPNIPASHNSLRVSVENYSTFEESQNNNLDSQLLNIGNHRIGSIGISCPGFDLKSYIRNATLAANPAYQISFDYSYLDNNKMAMEIWTIRDDKVYIIDYVTNEHVYDVTFPTVQKMIESFEITT